MSNSNICFIDRTLSGGTTPGQSGPENNGNEGVLRIPQISKDGTLPLDGLISYPGHSLGESYLSVVPVDWANSYMIASNHIKYS